jgi:hypothetical protein
LGTAACAGSSCAYAMPPTTTELMPLLEARHPELADGPDSAERTLIVAGEPSGSRLHLAMHHIDESQSLADGGPET